MEKIHKQLMSALRVLALAGGTLVQAEPITGDPPVRVTSTVDRPLLPRHAEDRKVVIKIEVEGAERARRSDRMPLNLAIVLDRSGSMSGAKLEQAKQAATMLVDQLDSEDVLSLVVYESEVDVLLHAARLGDRRREIKNRISNIQTGGSTALYAGVDCGGRELEEFLSRERINRVILLSDGIANVGPSSNRDIANLGQRLAERGGSVTTIGLGNDYNETLMTALAEASDANYYYVADVETLPEVFENELGELKSIVARDIEIEIHCPRGVRPQRFLGRPEKLKTQQGGAQRCSVVLSTLSSQQTREVYLECAIDEASFGGISEIAEVIVRYNDASGSEKGSVERMPIVVGYTDDVKMAEASVDAAVQAEAVVFANAEDTEKAIRLADSGDIAACREQLSWQIGNLKRAYTAAPAPQQRLLKEEIAAVEEAKADLADESLSKAQRKKLANGSFGFRNSKK